MRRRTKRGTFKVVSSCLSSLKLLSLNTRRNTTTTTTDFGIKYRKKERRKYLDILARGVDADDPLVMGKIESELAVVGGSALMATDQFVTVKARTFVASFFVSAQLIAEAPLLALVAIYR